MPRLSNLASQDLRHIKATAATNVLTINVQNNEGRGQAGTPAAGAQAGVVMVMLVPTSSGGYTPGTTTAVASSGAVSKVILDSNTAGQVCTYVWLAVGATGTATLTLAGAGGGAGNASAWVDGFFVGTVAVAA